MACDATSSAPRASVCFGLPNAGDVALPHEERYLAVLSQHYDLSEATVQEKAITLKRKAREADHNDFWRVICEGLADIFDAQVSFVSTRVTHDRSTGQELPALGEVGSYLNGLGLYFNEPSRSVHSFDREVLYKAWDCPCSGMKYGKVFIIPSDVSKFGPQNPNADFLPLEFESYIGVPCLIKGVSVGHFGLVWTKGGVERRSLSWGFIESTLHAFEDLIQSRIMKHIEHGSLNHWRSLPSEASPRDVTSVVGTFKPHAQVLSHELRTPMQGIVGTLDLIQDSLQDAVNGRKRLSSKELAGLLDNTYTAQASTRRVIEAMENIIEAYKLDMGRPHKSIGMHREQSFDTPTRIQAGPRARRLSAGAQSPRGKKRKHFGNDFSSGENLSSSVLNRALASPLDQSLESPSWNEKGAGFAYPDDHLHHDNLLSSSHHESGNELGLVDSSSQGLQACPLGRLVADSLHMAFNSGIKPDSITSESTTTGQILHTAYQKSQGEWQFKTIIWTIAADVPETLLVRQTDVEKMLACVLHNALKFTESAYIKLNVHLDESGRFVVFDVCDNGPGILPDFRPRLFDPFSKQDSGITRETEGLGLGLLIAKGLADKMGGDLNLTRSETEGEQHGSEFQIRIPITPSGAQTPNSHYSAPPSILGLGSTIHRRRSSASSHVLRTGHAPPSPDHQPFGQLSKDLLTPSSSVHVSPKLASAPEDCTQHHIVPVPSHFDHEDTQAGGAEPEKDHEDDTQPLTFLVVEDNDLNRKLLVKLLTKLGHDKSRIFEAYDGADAIRQVTERHAKHAEEVRQYGWSTIPPIDLVLMDIWMPKVDGYEATERILALYRPISDAPVKNGLRRCISEPGTVPLVNGEAPPRKYMLPPTIFAVTADATDDASAKAARAGMHGFMAKPFNMEHLRRLIDEAKRNRAQSRRAHA